VGVAWVYSQIARRVHFSHTDGTASSHESSSKKVKRPSGRRLEGEKYDKLVMAMRLIGKSAGRADKGPKGE
jgi:hypothetical protein